MFMSYEQVLFSQYIDLKLELSNLQFYKFNNQK